MVNLMIPTASVAAQPLQYVSESAASAMFVKPFQVYDQAHSIMPDTVQSHVTCEGAWGWEDSLAIECCCLVMMTVLVM